MEARTHCPNCGSHVEPLAFCGVCGKPLPQPDRESDRSLRGRLTTGLHWFRERPVSSLVVAALVVVFLLLLGDRAGLATLVALLIAPGLLIHYLFRLDLYEREPLAMLAGIVAAGGLLGLLGGWLSSVIFERFWFTDTGLNLGAIGFPGIAANGRDGLPFVVLLLNGLLMPVLTGAAIVGGAILLRRWPVFRNEIMDGMTLGGLAAAGFATVSTFVYYWPSVFDDLPDRPVSQWTALLAGTVVIRPVVLILAGSLLGIAAWQYLASRDVRAVLIAGIGGVVGWMALPLGSLVLARSGAVAEFIWYVVILVVVGALFREALASGQARDATVLAGADGQRRVVCPTCHRVTPDGSFCSFCRSPLHGPAPVALATVRQPETGPSVRVVDDEEPGAGTSVPRPSLAEQPVDDAPAFAPTLARRGAEPPREEPTATDDDRPSGATGTLAGWPAGAGLAADAGTPDIGQYPSTTETNDGTDATDGDGRWREREPGDGEVAQGDTAGDHLSYEDSLWSPEALPSADTDPTDQPGRSSVDHTDPVFPTEAWGPDTSREESNADDRSLPDPEPAASTGQSEAEPEDLGPGLPVDADVASDELEAAGAGTDHAADGRDSAEMVQFPPGDESVVVPRDGDASGSDASGSADGAPGAGAPVAVPPFRARAETPPTSTGRPVSSSSGRWFEASSGRPAESRPDPVAGPGTDGDDVAGRAREPIPLFPPASPIGLDQDQGGSTGRGDAGAEASRGRTTSPGLRWYRSGDANPDSGSDPSDSPPQEPVRGPLRDAGGPVPDAVAAVETTETRDQGAGRLGLWRQLTRGGRTTVPRAPQRDQDRQAVEPVEEQGPGDSER